MAEFFIAKTIIRRLQIKQCCELQVNSFSVSLISENISVLDDVVPEDWVWQTNQKSGGNKAGSSEKFAGDLNLGSVG